jgi:hypothetical protein
MKLETYEDTPKAFSKPNSGGQCKSKPIDGDRRKTRNSGHGKWLEIHTKHA